MELTEEQLEEARQELARREKARNDAYSAEWQRKQNEAEERFLEKQDRYHPDIDRDTRYEIYADYRDFFE